MTDNHLNFLCLVNGESTSFPVEIDPTKTIGDLKDAIKAKKTPRFDDVAADELILWRVSIPLVPKKDRKDLSLGDILSKEELDETDDLSDVFLDKPPKKTIHIIGQRPPPGDLNADIKKITDKFFAPGPIANFLNAFVRGGIQLPVTEGSVRGLPKAWRRTFGHPPDTRPSLLFLDLPDPSTPDPENRNLAADSIFNMVKENNRPLIPVFGVSGCGKTRAAFELLFQHWGFYFNSSHDDGF
ncbi:hypothetical protein BGX23_003894 [Mortierella sp. AD031]|nr:hypothetical protein BGX23_003894 [Mortierella sp. AD031]